MNAPEQLNQIQSNYETTLDLMDSDSDMVLLAIEQQLVQSTLNPVDTLGQINRIIRIWRQAQEMFTSLQDLPDDERLISKVTHKFHALHILSGHRMTSSESTDFDFLCRDLISTQGALVQNKTIAKTYCDYLTQHGLINKVL
jgi:hypothetical protein